MKFRVASIQFESHPGRVDENREKVRSLLIEAAKAGAELLLLPEFWNTGYDTAMFAAIAEYAEDSKGPSIQMLREIAETYQVHIISGSIAERKGDKCYNTSFLISPKGEILNKYRKVHLFHRETRYFGGGDEWVIEDLKLRNGNIRLGMTICYDLRFPEFFRNLALRGVQLFCVPTAWPECRCHEYRIFCQARAAENRSFLFSANHTGPESGMYAGVSLIVDPLGQILAEGGREEGYIMADLDTEIFDRKEVFNSIEDRKQIMDEIDDTQL